MAAEPSGIFLAKPERPGDGIPLAVKDLFDTAGLTTTYGSIIYADHVSLDGCFPLAPSYDHVGPMARSVGECLKMLRVLADGFEPVTVESLEEVEVGTAWLDRADPLVRARVHEAAELFPRRRELDLPLVEEIAPVFMREVADVHRELFAEFEDSYGDNVRTKIQRCLEVTDAQYERALRARTEYRERSEIALDGLDLVLSPTLAFVAPPLP